MTEEEWLTGTDLLALVKCLARRGSDRRHRLFACACLRRVWDLLTVDVARRAVEVTEAFVDGQASKAELRAANDTAAFRAVLDTESNDLRRAGERTRFNACALHAMSGALGLVMGAGDFRRSLRAHYVAEMTCANRARDYAVTRARPWGGKYWVPTDKTQLADRVRLLRDIFGNPFRPVTADPNWLTSTVVALARGLYDSRDFSPMPILADALQDAGCEHPDVLAHCRGDSPHVRGCWVVDMLLGKQ